MELRYTLAVVTPAGNGFGHDVALHLARAGAAVLVVDPDLVAAERTATSLSASRTPTWVLQADVGDPEDAALVARRARDLGGADVLVDLTAGGSALAELVRADEPARRGVRRAQPLAVVTATEAAAVTTVAGVVALLRHPS